MAYFCKGICKKYKGEGQYSLGNKRCNFCKIYMKFSGFKCPCCGYRLKSKPRASKRRMVHDSKTGMDKKRI